MHSNNRILYIVSNDLSDPRVSRELSLLSKHATVDIFALSEKVLRPFSNSRNVFQVKKNHKNLIGLFLLCFRLFFLTRRCQYSSVHVVDEQLWLFIISFLPPGHYVLDIFDSLMLKYDLLPSRFSRITSFFYSRASSILVTDRRRLQLYPISIQNKMSIFTNIPLVFPSELKVIKRPKYSPSEPVVVGVFGSLSKARGLTYIRQLLTASYSQLNTRPFYAFRIIMSGWLYDDYARSIAMHPCVDYMGVMSQDQVMTVMRRECHVNFAYYAPSSINNIFSSPNKIWDSAVSGCPVAINSSTLSAIDVLEKRIGFVYDDSSWSPDAFRNLVEQYYRSCNGSAIMSSSFSDSMRSEDSARNLLKAHNITVQSNSAQCIA